MATAKMDLWTKGQRKPAATVRFTYSDPRRGAVKVSGPLASVIDEWLTRPMVVYRPEGYLGSGPDPMPQHWDWLRAVLQRVVTAPTTPFERMKITSEPRVKRPPVGIADPTVAQ